MTDLRLWSITGFIAASIFEKLSVFLPKLQHISPYFRSFSKKSTLSSGRHQPPAGSRAHQQLCAGKQGIQAVSIFCQSAVRPILSGSTARFCIGKS
jgi:hypothetical protein